MAAFLVGVFFALTPHDHVAPGCWWSPAMLAGEVVPGDHGCLRGYVAVGGYLAEDPSSDSVVIPFSYADPDQAPRRAACPFRPGDAVVVTYHAVFDDGRTIAVIEERR